MKALGISPDALGPALNRTYFSVPEGRYKLVFNIDGVSDVYRMKVTTEYISIKPMLFNSLTRPTSLLFWRFRPNTFALFCGTPDSTSYLCDEIMDSLLAHLDIEEFTFPDTGVVGYGRTSYQYNASGRFFSYKDEADFHQAGQILTDFVHAHQAEFHKVGMWIINWRQESYLSWRLPS